MMVMMMMVSVHEDGIRLHGGMTGDGGRGRDQGLRGRCHGGGSIGGHGPNFTGRWRRWTYGGDVASGLCKVVTFLELGAMGGMTISMADTQILADEGAVALGEVTAVDLLGGV